MILSPRRINILSYASLFALAVSFPFPDAMAADNGKSTPEDDGYIYGNQRRGAPQAGDEEGGDGDEAASTASSNIDKIMRLVEPAEETQVVVAPAPSSPRETLTNGLGQNVVPRSHRGLGIASSILLLRGELGQLPVSLLQRSSFLTLVEGLVGEGDGETIHSRFTRLRDLTQFIKVLTSSEYPFSDEDVEAILQIPNLLRVGDARHWESSKAYYFAALLRQMGSASISLDPALLEAVYGGDWSWPIPLTYGEVRHNADCLSILLRAENPEQICAIRNVYGLRNPNCRASPEDKRKLELQVISELLKFPASLIRALKERQHDLFDKLRKKDWLNRYVKYLRKFPPQTPPETVEWMADHAKGLFRGLNVTARCKLIQALVDQGPKHSRVIITWSHELFKDLYNAETNKMESISCDLRVKLIQALGTINLDGIPLIAEWMARRMSPNKRTKLVQSKKLAENLSKYSCIWLKKAKEEAVKAEQQRTRAALREIPEWRWGHNSRYPIGYRIALRTLLLLAKARWKKT